MLDIFDEISQQELSSDKESFSIIEETQNNQEVNTNFLIYDDNEDNLQYGRKSSENHGIIISRKGSGVSAQMIKTPISFLYQTNQDFPETQRLETSNDQIGAALTPNLDFQKNKRRATRASESDILGGNQKQNENLEFGGKSRDTGEVKTQDFLMETRDKRNKRGKNEDKHLVTEDSYTEKFDYKKFINEELSKLGNICGYIFLFKFEYFNYLNILETFS